MKHLLLTTIAAVVLAGCGPQAPDLSIQHATTLAKIEIIKQHFADGTDINEKDSYGRTPLLCSITQGHEEIAELLIAEGADVNAKKKEGQTLLHEAANRNRKQIAVLLIANGAEVNAQADNGRTPLDYASFELVDILRKHGCKTRNELEAERK
ncbi:MAG: ankyrin repeat domain-containing protein [Pseudomonadota bacterium]|nr:ankyrin repeat domain-containing protein [Pseudomonadota bacterium]